MRTGFGLALGALLLVGISGCDSAEEAAPPSVPETKPGGVIREASVRPLRLSRRPIWDGRAQARFKVVKSIALHGDTVVMYAAARKGDPLRLVAVDVVTGKVRWSVSDGDRLRGEGAATLTVGEGQLAYPLESQIMSYGNDWGVLVTYNAAGNRGNGVALLSGRDGGVRWTSLVVPAAQQGAAGPSQTGVVGTDGRIVLASVTSAAPSPEGSGPERTVAADARTGRTLWSREDLKSLGVHDSTVLGIPGTGQAGPGAPSLLALDAATGRTRWDSATRLPGAVPLGYSGKALLAGRQAEVPGQPSPSSVQEYRLWEIASGRELAKLSLGALECGSDRTGLIACLTPASQGKYRLLTIGSNERTFRPAGRETDSESLSNVLRGRIFLSRTADSDRTIEVDRAGRLLNDRLPGYPLALSDRYALFQNFLRDGTTSHKVYRLA